MQAAGCSGDLLAVALGRLWACEQVDTTCMGSQRYCNRSEGQDCGGVRAPRGGGVRGVGRGAARGKQSGCEGASRDGGQGGGEGVNRVGNGVESGGKKQEEVGLECGIRTRG